MKKTLVLSIIALSIFVFMGCGNKNIESESSESNLTESVQTQNEGNKDEIGSGYEGDYTKSFEEIVNKVEMDKYISYDEVKDNELVKEIKNLLVDYWVNDGKMVYENGVNFIYSEGMVPFTKEKIEKLKRAKEAIISELKDVKLVDVSIQEIQWSTSIISKELDAKSLSVRYRLVDSEGNEYLASATGSLRFNIYYDNGVAKLWS